MNITSIDFTRLLDKTYRDNSELLSELEHVQNNIKNLEKQLSEERFKKSIIYVLKVLNQQQSQDFALSVSSLSSPVPNYWNDLIKFFKTINLEIYISENIRFLINELVIKLSTFDYEAYNKSSVKHVVNSEYDLQNIQLKKNDTVLLINQPNSKDNGVYSVVNESKKSLLRVSAITRQVELSKNNSIFRIRKSKYHKDKEGNRFIYFPVIRYSIGYYNQYFSNYFQMLFEQEIKDLTIVYNNNNHPIFCYKEIKFTINIYIDYEKQKYSIHSFIEHRTQALEITFNPKEYVLLEDFLIMMIGH